jgi:hypothetical protein
MSRRIIASLLIGVIAAAALLIGMPYFGLWKAPFGEVEIDPKWKSWHRERTAKLEEELKNTQFSNPPLSPTTAEEYLAQFQSDGSWNKSSLYIERLPFSEYRKVTQHFLDQFPIVDLQDRLRYEDDVQVMKEHAAKHRYDLAAVAATLHDDWNAYYYPGDGRPVMDWERPLPHQKELRRSRHQRALEILHHDRLEAFAKQNSFGFERIKSIDIKDLAIFPTRPSQPVKLPEPLPKEKRESSRLERELFENEKEWIKETQDHYPKYLPLSIYHQFADDQAYAPSFRQARGFTKHFADKSIDWDFDVYYDPNPPIWRVRSLELVSLLKHRKPKVYVSDALPNMLELQNAKTRELDDFEKSALEQLYAGEFLASSEATDNLRVLGAVRAGQTCTECHAVKPGQLLGAFSYRITKVQPGDLGDR